MTVDEDTRTGHTTQAEIGADLEAIEARVSAATGGPWTWDGRRVPTLSGVGGEAGVYTYEAEVLEARHNGGCGCRVECYLDLDVSPADAAFIAAARTDVVTLLAHVRTLLAENAALRAAGREHTRAD